ncbi:MAG: branched-chain amino acid transport system II carrier protein [Lactobacillaceae bacterium]|jgi:LIVCS family branched-chain amino acid:cation transporter|nr:branched-chain amino acid transport system II carrier protein [Lactobacillaceae bacterium]
MEEKLTFKQLFLLSSLIFGMMFGAGNLIFPVQLGQLAGGNWLPATLGFLVTGTLLPFLAMLAVSVTRSQSVYDVAKPVAPWFGTAFLVAIHLTIGPLFGTPRTAATAFSMGISPFVPTKYQWLAMLIFSAIFFATAYVLAIKESGLMKWVGKYLNPILMSLLVIVLVLAFILPMGGVDQTVSKAYQVNAGLTGILDGYNTMDGVALLALSVSVVYAIKGFGFHDNQVSKVMAKSGLLAVVAEAVIYAALVLLGVSSLGTFKAAANGGDAFASIIGHYTGNLGTLTTGIIVTLAVFTTAMGLFVSFAQDLHRAFPKVSYNSWLKVIAVGSFITANAGLTKIIAWSIPVLMLLYPFAMVLILLSLFNKLFNRNTLVYQFTVAFVTLPAFIDALASSPLATNKLVKNIIDVYHQLVPFSLEGFGWLIPALIGAVLGLVVYFFTQKIQN